MTPLNQAAAGPHPAPATSTDSVARTEVEAVIHATAEAWNSQDFANVLKLWDPDEPVPYYLAEEQDDWFIGWDALRGYLAPAKPSPAVQGVREEMRDIHVKFITSDVALAAWWLHFEMKIIGRKPIGEEVRVSAVLRRTAAGWRYIHWAESPMTASMYLAKLMERDVDQEKFAACHERSMQRWRGR
ncbi:MAG: nuclear transport factor 2 family protein [Gammaproteobacteria bacterium]